MLNLIKIENNKTYASKANAIKAVTKQYPDIENSNLRFFIHTTDAGRFIPTFIGMSAVQAGIHYHFNVIG